MKRRRCSAPRNGIMAPSTNGTGSGTRPNRSRTQSMWLAKNLVRLLHPALGWDGHDHRSVASCSRATSAAARPRGAALRRARRCPALSAPRIFLLPLPMAMSVPPLRDNARAQRTTNNAPQRTNRNALGLANNCVEQPQWQQSCCALRCGVAATDATRPVDSATEAWRQRAAKLKARASSPPWCAGGAASSPCAPAGRC